MKVFFCRIFCIIEDAIMCKLFHLSPLRNAHTAPTLTWVFHNVGLCDSSCWNHSGVAMTTTTFTSSRNANTTGDARRHTQALACRGGRRSVCVVYSPGWPSEGHGPLSGWTSALSSLSNMPLSYGAAVDVPQRATGLEKEMQRMLNTKPMAPDTPHPSLSGPSNLFLLTTPAAELPGLCGTFPTYGGIMLKGSPTGWTFRGI